MPRTEDVNLTPLENVAPMGNSKEALLLRLHHTPLFSAWPNDMIAPLLAQSQ
ncbi:MAG: Crp/Fnr family transcriptional regulator, partial [Acidithiobacillus ferrivorans]